MSAASPARFTFDLDLGRSQRKSRVLPEDELEALIARARAEGHASGLTEGREAAEAKSAEALAQAAEKLAGNAAAMAEALDARQRQTLHEATELAASVARKLAAHLVARHPQDELAALLSECMGSLDHAPHLVVRCHPELCDAMRAAAEDRMKSSGFAGRLVVMGDPDIGLGDGRIEWADGGLVRDIDAISGEIGDRISAFLAASGPKNTQGA